MNGNSLACWSLRVGGKKSTETLTLSWRSNCSCHYQYLGPHRVSIKIFSICRPVCFFFFFLGLWRQNYSPPLISPEIIGNAEVSLASSWYRCEWPRNWMPLYSSLLPEAASHVVLTWWRSQWQMPGKLYLVKLFKHLICGVCQNGV